MPLTPNVGTGQIIQSSWGNAIRDRTAQIFTNKADLDAQWPAAPNGAHAWVLDVARLYRRIAGAWYRCPDYGTATLAADGAGRIIVTHAVGTTPGHVAASPRTPGNASQLLIETLTATTFTVRLWGATGVAATGSQTVSWIAYP